MKNIESILDEFKFKKDNPKKTTYFYKKLGFNLIIFDCETEIFELNGIQLGITKKSQLKNLIQIL